MRILSSARLSLMQFQFNSNSPPVASAIVAWEQLDSPPKPLEFLANGKGEATLAASLIFTPSKLLPFPTYKGFYVQRGIRIGGSNAPNLKIVPVKSVVDITIEATTPDASGPSTVQVLMPAGLEPIDPNASDSVSQCSILEGFSAYEDFISCPDQVCLSSGHNFEAVNIKNLYQNLQLFF